MIPHHKILIALSLRPQERDAGVAHACGVPVLQAAVLSPVLGLPPDFREGFSTCVR